MKRILGYFLQQANQRGQMLVEILVAMAVAAIFIPALLTGIIASQEGKTQRDLRFDAGAYLLEAQEAFDVIQDQGWSAIPGPGVYHPEPNGSGGWTLVPGEQQIPGTPFTWSITIDDVWRDDNGDIVPDGTGTLDEDSLEIDYDVSWPPVGGPGGSEHSEEIINNEEGNTPGRDTTEDDFDDGTNTDTAVTNTSGGEVVLGPWRLGDWCDPEDNMTSIDIPGLGTGKTISAAAGAGMVDDSQILTGTTGDVSRTLVRLGIANANPPSTTGISSWNTYNTNEIFGLPNDVYAYVATPNNNKPVVKVRMSPVPFVEVGYFENDAGSNTDGKSVYVVGTTGYAIVGGKLWNFNTTPNPSNNRMPRLDSNGVDLYGNGATGTRVMVRGNYAFVAGDDANNAFQIYNISNPAAMTQLQKLNLNNRFAKDLWVNESATRAYVVTSDKNGKDPDGDGNGQLYIINIENKSVPTIINGSGTFTNGMRPRGVVGVDNGTKVVVVGRLSGSPEYQVFSLANEAAPALCGSADIAYDMTAVAAVQETDGDVYSYAMSKDTVNGELKAIRGGVGGVYMLSGTYTSAPFTATTSSTFNWIRFDTTLPAGTNIQFKVAIADQVAGSCTNANYAYTGPNKNDPNSFYSGNTQIGIPIDNNNSGYENPGQCLRYQAYLSTNNTNVTPVFTGVTFNYTP